MVINSILGFAVSINFITIWKDVYNIIYFQLKSIWVMPLFRSYNKNKYMYLPFALKLLKHLDMKTSENFCKV